MPIAEPAFKVRLVFVVDTEIVLDEPDSWFAEQTGGFTHGCAKVTTQEFPTPDAVLTRPLLSLPSIVALLPQEESVGVVPP